MHGDREDLLGPVLADHVLIEAFLDGARGGNIGRGLLGAAAALLFLIDDRLAEFNAFAADVHIAGAFDERSDVAVGTAAEGAVGIAISAGGAGWSAGAGVAG